MILRAVAEAAIQFSGSSAVYRPRHASNSIRSRFNARYEKPTPFDRESINASSKVLKFRPGRIDEERKKEGMIANKISRNENRQGDGQILGEAN